MRAVLVAIVTTLSIQAGAQVIVFQGLGTGPNPGGWSIASSVNADGSVVAGWATAPGTIQHTPYVAFRWTPSGGLRELGAVLGIDNSYTRDLSSSGSVLVGMAYGGPGGLMHGWRWTAAEGAVPVGPLPGDNESDATSVSADGSVIAVNSYRAGVGYRVARWTAQTGPVDIGGFGGQTYCWAISADGQAIVGWSNHTSYRWTSAGGLQPIDAFSAMAVSADGSVVVGVQFFGRQTFVAFRWTETGGSELLVDPSGDFMAFGEGVSGDGRTIVGPSGPSPDLPDGRAMYWMRELGLVDLNIYLPAHGVDLTGWILNDAAAISGDGRTVVGTGLHNGQHEAWLARIPRCGSADFNNDGDIGSDLDIAAFFACLVGNCCPTCGSADFNDDDDVGTDLDIEAFFRVLAGEPC